MTEIPVRETEIAVGAFVLTWSSVEVRALRLARRMSIREFADHLGIASRMVSKWEAGPSVHPRPVNQAALDTSLAQADARARERFAFLLNGPQQTAVRGCPFHGGAWDAPSSNQGRRLRSL